MDAISITQVILAALFVLGAGAAAFVACRNRNSIYPYLAIVLLGCALFCLFPSLWLILCTCVMTFGGCVLFYGQKKNIQKKSIMGIAILLAGTIAFVVVQQLIQPDGPEKMHEKQMRYDLAQYEILGRYAKEHYSGQTIAAVIPKEKQPRHDELLKAFEKGYGSSVTVVEYDPFDMMAFIEENGELKENNPKRYQALLAKEEVKQSFEAQVLAGADDADVVLFVSGLPGKRMECLRALNAFKKAKKTLLIPSGCGGETSVLAPFIEKGTVGAFVMIKGDSSIQNDIPEDPQEAFNSRFEFVTSENIEEKKNDPMLRDEEEIVEE